MILITGGLGFIGSHTCAELLNSGEDLIIIDNLSNSSLKIKSAIENLTGKEVKVYIGDVQNEILLNEIFSDNKISSVIHFAGLKAVGESVDNPLKYYDWNINSTITLCRVMSKFNVKNLIFSSSATVYTPTENCPIKEDYPLGPTNPYGNTKYILEIFLKDIENSDKEWSIGLLRYFNPVGAHESAEIGELPNGIPNNLMPRICDVAVGKTDKITIFGTDYPTKDGSGVRDYIHVVDLAKGHVKALEYIKQNKGVHIYNLGTGIGYSVLDIINAFETECNVIIPKLECERRSGDIAECYSDVNKAKNELNWTAQKTINDMVRDSYRFASKNK